MDVVEFVGVASLPKTFGFLRDVQLPVLESFKKVHAVVNTQRLIDKRYFDHMQRVYK